jgi:hypothetical protein
LTISDQTIEALSAATRKEQKLQQFYNSIRMARQIDYTSKKKTFSANISKKFIFCVILCENHLTSLILWRCKQFVQEKVQDAVE